MPKTDPRNMRPSDLARALNSTPLGEVVGERLLYRHRMRAGYRIGDGRHIDMLRYAAWLVDELEDRRSRPPADPRSAYEAQKARAAARNAELARAGQDIGELPEVVNPERKNRATGNFRFFCETYFPEIFYLPWSPDHHRVIDKIERAVLNGGLFALAMPRGSGKTVLCQTAVVWAALVGAAPFVCLIAASAERATQLLETVKTWLETNPLLLEDWPEVVYPIRALERITNRQKGQRYKGEPTRIEWNADKIVLPTVAGSKASGVVVSCSGMKGSDIRGQNHARADGQVVRPHLVLVDDPQTTESAWSPSQSQRREAILAGDVLGMAGPGKKIAGLMCATVIRPSDMADNILDRQKHPEWQGERTKMVYAFPANEKLWAQYGQIRAESLRNDGDGREATEFYSQHRQEMDCGAIIAWPERYNDDELSAIQHAMNLKLRDEAAFFAEYQNEPLVQEEGGTTLSADDIAAKVSGHPRGEIPIGASHLTMFIDVQGRLLFHVVAAWEEDFTGYVVDYGAWPDQQRGYFTLRDARKTLESVSPQAGQEGAIYAGLQALTDDYLARSWRREDGAMLKIDRCLIDANWGQSTDVVYQFCRQSAHSTILLPSHGKYVGATSTPFSEYRRKKGDRIGLHWRIPNVQGRRQVRYVLIDTNYWKSFIHARLAVPMGDAGCLSLFGRRAEEHRLLAEHLTAEYPVRAEARGRTVDEWKQRVSAIDNHWLDCLVGCAVAGSIQGAVLFGTQERAAPAAKRMRLSEVQARKQASPSR
ncbi:MAG: terminase gpA endonuclease subunit [Phycisphaerae bacterium]